MSSNNVKSLATFAMNSYLKNDLNGHQLRRLNMNRIEIEIDLDKYQLSICIQPNDVILTFPSYKTYRKMILPSSVFLWFIQCCNICLNVHDTYTTLVKNIGLIECRIEWGYEPVIDMYINLWDDYSWSKFTKFYRRFDERDLRKLNETFNII